MCILSKRERVKINTILKKIRTEKKLAQKEIAEKVGISVRNYQYIEANKRLPNVKTAIKIAETLDTDVKELWKNS